MRRRKTVLWAVLILILCGASVWLILGLKTPPDPCLQSDAPLPKWAKKDLAGFTDDFDSVHPRWNFGDVERSGYHRLVKASGNGCAEIGIQPVDRYGDSDCSFEETRLLRRAGLLSLRAKHSEKLKDFSGGTLGFGLWNNRDGYHWDAAWFVACSKASSPKVYGLSVMILEDSKIVFRKAISVDISNWHDYSIKITPDGVTFSVDGRDVAHAEGVNAARSCKGIVAWVDNKAVDVYENSHKIDFIPVTKKSFMLLDSVSWTQLD
ncbi:MAG: hypothetical protein HZB23_06325 [Deltaproteobacteria bacterium]|nr:hypothetical protein [Deltaproteobacteria bacterium]